MIYVHTRMSLLSMSPLLHEYCQWNVIFIVELNLLVYPEIMQALTLGVPPGLFAIRVSLLVGL